MGPQRRCGAGASGTSQSHPTADEARSATQSLPNPRGYDTAADVGDIARLTFFVVGWTQTMAEELLAGISRAQESHGFSAPMPPLTVIGVQALWAPDFLVEIEATAVLP